MRSCAVAALALLLLAGCGEADESAETSAVGEPAEEAVPSTMGGGEEAEPPETTVGEVPTTAAPDGEEVGEEVEKLPEPVPVEPGEPVTGEADGDLVTSIIADAVARTGAVEGDVTVIRSESVIWNDGSLGCPLPGESYTMALVNGYWVVLEIGGVEYDYRGNDRGYFRLCEGGGAAPSNPTG